MEKSCTMLIHFDKPQAAGDIKEALETGDGPTKAAALKSAVMMLLNGEQLPTLFITIVRYVLPSDDNHVRKLEKVYTSQLERGSRTFYPFISVAFFSVAAGNRPVSFRLALRLWFWDLGDRQHGYTNKNRGSTADI